MALLTCVVRGGLFDSGRSGLVAKASIAPTKRASGNGSSNTQALVAKFVRA
jgi:hypothetical protein